MGEWEKMRKVSVDSVEIECFIFESRSILDISVLRSVESVCLHISLNSKH